MSQDYKMGPLQNVLKNGVTKRGYKTGLQTGLQKGYKTITKRGHYKMSQDDLKKCT